MGKNKRRKNIRWGIVSAIFIMLFILAIAGIISFSLFLYLPTHKELNLLKEDYNTQKVEWTRKNDGLQSDLAKREQKLNITTKTIEELRADIARLNIRVSELRDLSGNLEQSKSRLEQEKEDIKLEKEQLEYIRNRLITAMEKNEQERIELQERLQKLLDSFQATEEEKSEMEKQLENLMYDIQATEEEKLSLKNELQRKQEELEKLKNINQELLKRFEFEIQAGEITIARIGDRLTLDVSNKILFEIGEYELNDRGKEVLEKVAEVVKNLDDKYIQVGGHTDDTPIKSGNYTNWELASARAVNVVKFLQNEGVSPTNIYAASFGEYQPKYDNTTPEGRAMNRRIDIQILPKPVSIEEIKLISTINQDEKMENNLENETNEAINNNIVD